MAGTTYPAFIDREDEEIVREAARQVNIRYIQNRQAYAELSHEKVIAITALELALQMLDLKDKNDTEPYMNKIKELTEVLDNHFRETT